MLVKRRADADGVFLRGFALWLTAMALNSHIHIRFRHVMPVLSFLILGCGFALAELVRRLFGRIFAAALLAWLVAESIWIYPNGISYFNEWIGGPGNGWHYLADSNIDWGQNFRDLRRYAVQHKIAKMNVALFGLDPIEHYLPWGTFESIPFPTTPPTTGDRTFHPTPGYYAISVNTLVLHTLPKGCEDYLQWFERHPPAAHAGYSILIYRVQ